MTHSIRQSRLKWIQLGLWILLLCRRSAQAETFPIQMGDTISQDTAALGAGFIPDPSATDTLRKLSTSTDFEGPSGPGDLLV